MTLVEFFLRVAYNLQPMVPALMTAAIATFAAAMVLFLLCRNTWIDQKRFRVLGLFFGLSKRGRLHLACAWVRLVFVVTFVAAFQAMEGVQYIMVLVTGLAGIVLEAGIRKRLESLIWLALQMLGLFSANLVCRFVLEMSGSPIFLLIYIAMGLFLVLFSLYLFLGDLGSISGRRHIDARKVWGPEPAGEEPSHDMR